MKVADQMSTARRFVGEVKKRGVRSVQFGEVRVKVESSRGAPPPMSVPTTRACLRNLK